MFVHSDGQLRAAHLILSYTLISKSYQAMKCVIKANDPHLHRISVVVPDFLTTDSILEGIPKVTSPLQYTTRKATSSHPVIKEEGEEEKKEKEKEEEVVEVSDSEDEFSIFNQLPSPKPLVNDSSHLPLVQVSSTQEDTIVPEVMGIQRKPRTNLLDVMESQAWGKAQKKTSQAKLPPLLPIQPL